MTRKLSDLFLTICLKLLKTGRIELEKRIKEKQEEMDMEERKAGSIDVEFKRLD